MSNAPIPFMSDPTQAWDDESLARARIAQSLGRLSGVLPAPSAPDVEWRRLWESFSTQLVSSSFVVLQLLSVA
jgi:hypothetical protein